MTEARMLFVNHAVDSIAVTRAFFEKLGFEYNDQFSDDTTGCLVLSEGAFVMQLEKARFSDFTDDAIADTLGSGGKAVREVLLAVSAESREAVDALVDGAVAAGGTDTNRPQDHGFMYSRAFNDVDGHTWEVVWMDQSVPDSGPSPEEWAEQNG